ncbi:Sperm flagellar protein 1 [Orchesella cincta]|uniref:Sperm flagellar protein 1 n=1 Tax=Orchesella cincta TaxID=48709 RepID=A0A1D2N2A5_ORCCI|nr:Sperm flagellar protein 1 [Orchesella cincta]
MASVGEVDERDCLNPQDLEELYSWIDTVPLSRPKKNINRDFSDGVSVAELVHFYMPRLIELHNYVNASSSAQKRINWSMLNRKVFVKLNIRLSEKVIDHIVEARQGAIEQVLWDLRKKVLEMNPKSISRNLSRSNTATLIRAKSSSGNGYAEGKLGRKSPSSTASSNVQVSRIPTKSFQPFPSPSSATPPKVPTISSLKTTSKPSDGSSYSDGLKNELSQYGTSTNSSALKGSEAINGSSPSQPGPIDLNANATEQASLPPAHLIYKGHKMIPALLLDIKNRQIRDLEAVVNGLQKKVNFLDNLIQLKDNRVEDLTRQLHTLKTKFQDLTQTRISDIL